MTVKPSNQFTKDRDKKIKNLLSQVRLAKRRYQEYVPLLPEEKKQIEAILNTDSIHNSTAIEGNKYTRVQTELLLNKGLVPSGVTMKDTLEIYNLNRAMKYNNSYEGDITEGYIKKLHLLTTSGLFDDSDDSGNYKRCKNWIGDILTASPQETPKRMSELIDWYNYWDGNMDPIELAVKFKYKFLAIHPFVDGNGRVSRLILDRMLMNEQYLPARILLEDVEDYYKALSLSTKDDCSELIIFICKSILKTYDRVFKLLS